MGVTKKTFDYINQWFRDDIHQSVCEFGDQQFMFCPPFIDYSWTSTYFKAKKKKYVSIDLSGRGGSLMYDLNKPLAEQGFVDKFDFVTDFGTLEHVNDIYYGFKNMYDVCNYGGMMMHVLPSLNHWPNHGTWRMSRKFFSNLAKTQGYKLLSNFEDTTNYETGNGGYLGLDLQIFVVMEKQSYSEFMDKETFDTLGAVQAYPLENWKMGE